MVNASTFDGYALVLDREGGRLLKANRLDQDTPVQKRAGLSLPSGLQETSGFAFGAAALVSQEGSGELSLITPKFASSPVVTGLLAPTGLATPELTAEGEVWILESGRGQILKLTPVP